MNRNLLAYIFVFFASLAAICLFWFVIQFWSFYHVSSVVGNQAIDYILPRGANTRQVANDLVQKGLLKHPKIFIILSRLKGESRRLKAGGYRLYPGITENQILDQIIYGKVAIDDLTIIEGWSVKEMLQAIAKDPHILHTLQDKSPRQIANLLNIKQSNPEGWFFPDTYHFPWGTTDLAILQRAHELMQQKLQLAWQNRAPGLWYRTPYQALIVASLVVKEAKLASEHPLVAAVILNRLRQGIKLQIDPTVIYGMGEQYKGKITTKALRQPTPYNTYTKYGLPPTPISLPGEASLYAALHPENSKFIYFVAKGDGSHIFSATLKQHDQAIRKYILHEK